MDDLAVLFPAPVTVHVAGIQVKVPELILCQLPAFMAAAAPLLSALDGGGRMNTEILTERVDDVIQLIVICCGVERAWVETLPAREALKLVEAIIEVNADFFIVALPAFSAKLTARAVRLTAGPAPSNG